MYTVYISSVLVRFSSVNLKFMSTVNVFDPFLPAFSEEAFNANVRFCPSVGVHNIDSCVFSGDELKHMYFGPSLKKTLEKKSKQRQKPARLSLSQNDSRKQIKNATMCKPLLRYKNSFNTKERD